MPAPPPSQAYVPLDELARKPAEDTQPSHPPPGHKHPAQPPAPADAAHGADNSGGILKVLPRAVRGLTRARAVRDALQQGSSVAVRAEMEVEPGQVASCLNHWAVVEGNGGARWVHRGQAPEGMGVFMVTHATARRHPHLVLSVHIEVASQSGTTRSAVLGVAVLPLTNAINSPGRIPPCWLPVLDEETDAPTGAEVRIVADFERAAVADTLYDDDGEDEEKGVEGPETGADGSLLADLHAAFDGGLREESEQGSAQGQEEYDPATQVDVVGEHGARRGGVLGDDMDYTVDGCVASGARVVPPTDPCRLHAHAFTSPPTGSGIGPTCPTHHTLIDPFHPLFLVRATLLLHACLARQLTLCPTSMSPHRTLERAAHHLRARMRYRRAYRWR